MKLLLRLVLAASLLGNLALLVAFARHPAPRATLSNAPEVASSPATPSTGARRSAEPLPLWKKISAPAKLGTLPHRLLATGFEPDVRRAIVLGVAQAAIDESTLRSLQSRGYWSDPLAEVRETRAVERDLTIATARALEEAGLPDAPEENLPVRMFFGSVNRVRGAAALAVIVDYGHLKHVLAEPSVTLVFPSDRAAFELLDRNERADLARVLSPEEFAAYERMHPLPPRTVRRPP